MKKHYIQFYTGLLIASFAFLHFNCASDKEDSGQMSKEDLIARGEYLVDFGGCNDCHSPKNGFDEKGPVLVEDRILSGHPASEPLDTTITGSKWIQTNPGLTSWGGPWGISFAANLTPDGPTGLGNWTEEIFIKAMRTGKHMGAGRPILPPMPYFSVASLNDEDMKAVFAYLKSLKPVSNKVPDPIPPKGVPPASEH